VPGAWDGMGGILLSARHGGRGRAI
jgi:hypothetical protein